MTNYTFSRFVYFDTNIHSYVAQNNHLWPKILEFCSQNNYTIAFSEINASELSDATKIHASLVSMFMSFPSAIIIGSEQILDEEVKAYPSQRSESLLSYPLNALLIKKNGLDEFFEFLSSSDLSNARRDQIHHAKLMPERHSELKSNFPPEKNGKYSRSQSKEFEKSMVQQFLATEHQTFLQDKGLDLDYKKFLSVRLYAQVIFYKYYLGRRNPKQISEFADLGHQFYLPYCELAVMEKDLCNVLNQIKRNSDTLQKTQVANIEFIREFER